MSRAASDPALADDAGLSLIELIVVVVLVGLLGGVVVMILVNSWNTQEDVNSTTIATNEGQVYASSIERAVRNAEAIRVTDGTLLEVRTTLGGDRTCQAFKLSAADPPATGDAAFLEVGAAAPVWTGGPTITDDVSPLSTFYFVKSGQVVTYGFHIDTDASPVTFDGEVSARNNLSEAGAPCWS